jgi:hypothetical protein
LTCAVVPATLADDGFIRECLVGPPAARVDFRQKMRGAIVNENEHPVVDSSWKLAAAPRIFDLAALAGPLENTAVPIHFYVYSDADRNVQFWLGATGGIRLIVDGNCILTNPAARPCTPDEDKSPKFTLRKGWHDLMLTVTRTTGPWQFCLRLRNETGGPPEGLAYSARRPWK